MEFFWIYIATNRITFYTRGIRLKRRRRSKRGTLFRTVGVVGMRIWVLSSKLYSFGSISIISGITQIYWRKVTCIYSKYRDHSYKLLYCTYTRLSHYIKRKIILQIWKWQCNSTHKFKERYLNCMYISVSASRSRTWAFHASQSYIK
jgi:hypothetical protein